MSNNQNQVILRFDNVNFSYGDGKHPILIETDFSVRQNNKITIMWQNGAWKTTIFKLISGELKPQSWKINIAPWSSIAISKQILSKDQINLSIKEYFETAFKEKDYQLDRKIEDILKVVNFDAPKNKKLGEYSGWQQSRLLLAHALIQHPDILLLDEPTNNLDDNGIWDLISFLISYDKTVIVISHDADFLNLFTDGVLYLNVFRKNVEQYRWDYYTVLEQINSQIEKEQMQNARAEKKIADAKEKINFFSNKWGKMRKLASKMRDEVAEAEENIVDVRKDDKTIKPFIIEFGNFIWPIVSINKVWLMNSDHQVLDYKLPLVIKKGERHILTGPNWIWKSTLLKKLMMIHTHKSNIMKEYIEKIEKNKEDLFLKEPDTTHPQENEAMIYNKVRVWYYSQDFSTLDMNMTVRNSLQESANQCADEDVYRVAAQFLLTGNLLKNNISSLSEWQKWLLCYAKFVLQKPHLLILDEPTNHINFRHIPIIAQSLNKYEWAIIMVSHDIWFTSQLENFNKIDLWKLI